MIPADERLNEVANHATTRAKEITVEDINRMFARIPPPALQFVEVRNEFMGVVIDYYFLPAHLIDDDADQPAIVEARQ